MVISGIGINRLEPCKREPRWGEIVKAWSDVLGRSLDPIVADVRKKSYLVEDVPSSHHPDLCRRYTAIYSSGPLDD